MNDGICQGHTERLERGGRGIKMTKTENSVVGRPELFHFILPSKGTRICQLLNLLQLEVAEAGNVDESVDRDVLPPDKAG